MTALPATADGGDASRSRVAPRVNSCLLLTVALDGAEVTTVEGLASLNAGARAVSDPDPDPDVGSAVDSDGAPHPLQRAFLAHDALLCGYFAPGQLWSAIGVLVEVAALQPCTP
ncbi:aerobic-type carbon monoxide dehydrogenase small subunit (CoxS/CutS family) [Streptomyces sp. PvR034]